MEPKQTQAYNEPDSGTSQDVTTGVGIKADQNQVGVNEARPMIDNVQTNTQFPNSQPQNGNPLPLRSQEVYTPKPQIQDELPQDEQKIETPLAADVQPVATNVQSKLNQPTVSTEKIKLSTILIFVGGLLGAIVGFVIGMFLSDPGIWGYGFAVGVILGFGVGYLLERRSKEA